MKWNKRFEYPKSVRSLVNDARHYEVGNEKLPSVTTILAATQSIEKKESISKWIAKKGKNEADRIKNEAGKSFNPAANNNEEPKAKTEAKPEKKISNDPRA